MPAYFPHPYPDELFYSLIARYHVRSGNLSSNQTSKELFGSDCNKNTIELPSHLEKLINNLTLVTGLTIKGLIMNNTLFPYYTAFLPESRVNIIFNSMKDKYSAPILGCKMKPFSPILKYCSKCNIESLSRYGEYYWHRMHNIQGACICSLHKSLLNNSIIFEKSIMKNFIAANKDNCPFITLINIYSEEDFLKLQKNITDIEWLFSNYEKIRMAANIDLGFRKRYHFIGESGTKVRIKDLKQYYGESFLELLKVGDEGNFRNWLSDLYSSKYGDKIHPIRHLLLMRLISGSLANFINNLIDENLQGLYD
jgi:hypothetical protein